MTGYDEASMIAEAIATLDDGDEVLGAGFFGAHDLTKAATLGSAGGGILFGSLGAIVGMLTAKHVTAQAQGMTRMLLVAVTPTMIHVMNHEGGPDVQKEFMSFRRDSVEASVSTLGASKYPHLTDTETGAKLVLHGTLSSLSPQAEGDRIVFDLLTA